MFPAGGGNWKWTMMDYVDCLWECSRSSDQLQRRRVRLVSHTWTCCNVFCSCYRRRLCRSACVARSKPSVCLSVCQRHRPNSKTNDPKVFKLGIGNDLGIYLKWYDFGFKRSNVKLTVSISPFWTANRDSSTFARWHSQSSAWDRTSMWVPSSLTVV